MGDLVKFVTKTSAEYSALTKDENTLYFITDNHKLYKGSTEWCPQGSYTPPAGLMVIRGDISFSAGQATIPTGYSKGDAYYINSSGTFGSTPVAAGDLAIAMTDFASSSRASDFEIYRSAKNIHETVWE